MTATLPVHDRLATLADPTRCRLLLALEGHELTVGELCAALQLPQSTVSRHLRLLADDAWVTSRADGPSRWYRMADTLDADSVALWSVVRTPVRETPAADQDAARLSAVLAARRTRSDAFFAAASTEWDTLRTTLFGARADLLAALALCDPTWVLGDLGCGTGILADALAPHVAQVHAVDASPAMLAAARTRLAPLGNVTVHDGALEALPLPDATLDVAMLLLVLHHVADPVRALCEVHRVLRPGGRLLIADMRAHAHTEYQQQMGHVWCGFDAPQLSAWLQTSGFTAVRYTPLPVDPAATGPALFTATAVTDVGSTLSLPS